MGSASLMVLWGYGSGQPLILIGATCLFITSFALLATRSTLHTWGWILGSLWITSILFFLWRLSNSSSFGEDHNWVRHFLFFLITCWVLPFLGSSLLFAFTFDHENNRS